MGMNAAARLKMAIGEWSPIGSPGSLVEAGPPWGIAGNRVVIDHRHGESSLLAHMQPGSILVKKGDHVKQDELVGRLGNAGATTAPHLHYQLMDGPTLLRSDGLPARFDDTCAPKPGQWCDAK
jgi:murein DD-endopeptidase MepM/ murein hydrolase activator NlpD